MAVILSRLGLNVVTELSEVTVPDNALEADARTYRWTDIFLCVLE